MNKKTSCTRINSKCIYCQNSEGEFKTQEHFFPESLGGGEWSVLPDGLMCDACQRYFGTKVERLALSDWPFNFVRFNMSIPTKKKKPAQMDTDLGHMTACKIPGYSKIHLKSGVSIADKFPQLEIQIPAFPNEPRLVCRTLVKIAIGSLANIKSVNIFAPQFNPARQFSRFDDNRIKWWYLERVDRGKMRKAFELGADV